MFTGIVQTMGIVRSVREQAAGARLVLDARDLERPIADGASISVSGVCLTVVRSDPSLVEFDVVPETLRRTTLGSLSAGDRVNLELSLRAGDRMDGHVVQGHVDGIGRVARLRTAGAERICTFTVDELLVPFLIPKGSVAIDGVSLTIAAVEQAGFDVALIPTTLARTTLSLLRAGGRVNIETDIIARTVVSTLERWHTGPESEPMTFDTLRAQGW